MPRPKIRPISAEAAAAGQAAIDAFAGDVFVPPGAASYNLKGGRTGRRWSARLDIEKATVDVGGTKDEPNDDEAVYYIYAKALPLNVDEDKQVPVCTPYHIHIRVNYAKTAEGDEMALRNEAVLTSLFSALGVPVKDGGVPLEVIEGAFPEKGEAVSSLAGQRVMTSLSLNPPKEGAGRGYLNVDRFMPDISE